MESNVEEDDNGKFSLYHDKAASGTSAFPSLGGSDASCVLANLCTTSPEPPRLGEMQAAQRKFEELMRKKLEELMHTVSTEFCSMQRLAVDRETSVRSLSMPMASRMRHQLPTPTAPTWQETSPQFRPCGDSFPEPTSVDNVALDKEGTGQSLGGVSARTPPPVMIMKVPTRGTQKRPFNPRSVRRSEVVRRFDSMATAKEKRQGLRKAGKDNEPDSEPQQQFPTEDSREVMQQKKLEQEKMLKVRMATRKEQFNRLDVHGSGRLSPQVIVELAEEFYEELDEEAVEQAFLFLHENTPEELEGLKLPAAMGDTGAAESSSSLGFVQFVACMDDMALTQQAPIEVQHTIECLRSLCRTEANEARTKAILAHEQDKQKRRRMRTRLMVVLDIISVLIIIINSLLIGFSVEFATNSAGWDVVEIVFLAYYISEVVVKIRWFGLSEYIVGSEKWWNAFDVMCVLCSVFDISLTMILKMVLRPGEEAPDMGPFMLVKMFRMFRLARIIRVVRFKMFKELKLIILGLISGLRALFWAVVLLLGFIYVLAILMKMLVGSGMEEFQNLPAAMFTLFRCFTDGCSDYGGRPLSEILRKQLGGTFFILYILIMMMVTVGIFNLIMAVFIDNVTKSQQQRKQRELGETMESVAADLKLLVARFIISSDPTSQAEGELETEKMSLAQSLSARARAQLNKLTDDEGARTRQTKLAQAEAAFAVLTEEEVTITRDVFNAWLHNKDFVQVLDDAEVDISNKFELFDILDVDMGGELSAEELIHGLLKLRGEVSKGDIVAIMLQVQHMIRSLDQLQEKSKSSEV
eukprot:TRINITY_DN9737_c1_g1_i1.p1 TRINITY_DN9737_c1_g1~~TRINITY_DN9737_c1_g1_i1.p1  ORF type:complete len:818 (-),score=176.95 TRINITY_DN9737_c1_g1_i1:74-2497(-)